MKAYQILCIKRGNPIIPTETEQIDIARYERLCNEVENVQGLSKLTLEPSKLIIIRDGKRKSFKYTSDVSVEWVLSKLGLIDLKTTTKRRTVASLAAENARLLELAKAYGLKV